MLNHNAVKFGDHRQIYWRYNGFSLSHDLVIPLFFFFLSGFSFTNIHDSRDSRGRGRVSI